MRSTGTGPELIVTKMRILQTCTWPANEQVHKHAVRHILHDSSLQESACMAGLARHRCSECHASGFCARLIIAHISLNLQRLHLSACLCTVARLFGLRNRQDKAFKCPKSQTHVCRQGLHGTSRPHVAKLNPLVELILQSGGDVTITDTTPQGSDYNHNIP